MPPWLQRRLENLLTETFGQTRAETTRPVVSVDAIEFHNRGNAGNWRAFAGMLREIMTPFKQSKIGGGEGGIRTPEAPFEHLHDFQSCSFSRLGHLSARDLFNIPGIPEGVDRPPPRADSAPGGGQPPRFHRENTRKLLENLGAHTWDGFRFLESPAAPSPPRANISKRFRPTCREFQPNAPRPEQYRSPRFRPAQENIRANAPRPAHIRTPPFKGLPGGNSGPFVRIFNQMRRGPRIFAHPPFPVWTHTGDSP